MSTKSKQTDAEREEWFRSKRALNRAWTGEAVYGLVLHALHGELGQRNARDVVVEIADENVASPYPVCLTTVEDWIDKHVRLPALQAEAQGRS